MEISTIFKKYIIKKNYRRKFFRSILQAVLINFLLFSTVYLSWNFSVSQNVVGFTDGSILSLPGPSYLIGD